MKDEDNEYTHPGLRMVRDASAFHILLPVKAQRFRKLLHLVWFVVWAVVEAALVASLLGWKFLMAPPAPVLIAFLGVFTVAGAFVLYRFLWYWAGRESFIVSPDRLTVRREIWGIGHTRTFEREKIRDVRAQRFDYAVVYPSWGRMFIGHGDGEILIVGDGATFAYGKGLEEEEARKLAALLKQELQLRPRDRRPSELRAV